MPSRRRKTMCEPGCDADDDEEEEQEQQQQQQ